MEVFLHENLVLTSRNSCSIINGMQIISICIPFIKSKTAPKKGAVSEVNILKEVQNNWPAGIKRTKHRESVLSILENSEKPLSAADICAQMGNGQSTAWMSTVYRILETFLKKDIVVKTTLANNEMAVYELNRFEHKHYAVCLNCHKIIGIDNCPMEKFVPELEEEGFYVMGHNLEIFGLCKDCNAK